MSETPINLPALTSTNSPALWQPGAKSAREAIEDYFGAKISNANTRSAYLRDAHEFAAWTADRGLMIEQVRTLDVAAFRDELRSGGNSAATVKRKISALRKLLSYLVETGALPYNPAREVTTEKVRRVTGKTPALSQSQMHTLFESFSPKTPDGIDEPTEKMRLIDLRDRAMIGVMAYTFARVSAVCGLKAQDYIDLGRDCVLRLHEKGGVEREIPVHPKLAEYLDAWVKETGLKGNAVLFPSFTNKGSMMTARPILRVNVFDMVKRRMQRAELPSVFGNHSFRATGITRFLEGGGNLETAQQIANHADSRTTKLYDRRATGLELSEIVKISY